MSTEEKSDVFVESELFGDGETTDESSEVSGYQDNSSSHYKRQHNAEAQRSHFRSSRNSDINLAFSSESCNDDMFSLDNDSLRSPEKVIIHSQSDTALPDLVRSSSGGESCDDCTSHNADLNSPDVISQPNQDFSRQKSILKTCDVVSGENTQKPSVILRSVSFQDESKSKMRLSSSSEEKRDNFRKSSGYITGSEGSLKSQNSQTSNTSTDAPSDVFHNSREEEDLNQQNCKQIGNVPFFGEIRDSLMSSTDSQMVFQSNEHSKVCITENTDVKSDTTALPPSSVEFIYSSDSKNVSIECNIVRKKISSSKVNENNRSTEFGSEGFGTEGIIIPHSSIIHSVSVDGNGCQTENNHNSNSFELFSQNIENLPSFEESSQNDDSSSNQDSHHLPDFGALLPADDDSVQLPSNVVSNVSNSPSISPSIRFVQNNYCNEDRRSPDNYTASLTPSQIATVAASPFRESKHSFWSQQTYAVDMSEIFLEHPEWFDYNFPYSFYKRIMNMPSDGSISASPSPYLGFKNDPHQTIENGTHVTKEMVEIASRCQDNSCQNKVCYLVRSLLYGLQHVLDGLFSCFSTPGIQDLCLCLFQHARMCDGPLYRCLVPWCSVLRTYSNCDEMAYCVQLIFHWIKANYETPIMTDDVIPAAMPNKFVKLKSNHHHQSKTSFDVLYPVGRFGNVLIVMETNPNLETPDTEDETMLYVIKRIHNMEFSDFDQCDVFLRLIDHSHDNLISHFWFAVYNDVIHICTEHISGGSLEELLCQQILLVPLVVLQMMVQISSAINFLHQHGIIYLYWSSGNILLDNVRQRVVVSNLSLAVTVDDSDPDFGYTKMSLPPWLVPPEILDTESNTINIGPHTDCWGAACLMVEMLTGHRVWYHYRHNTPEELWQKIQTETPVKDVKTAVKHKDLIQLLYKCFKLNFEDRISFEEFRQTIEHLLHQFD